MVILNTNGDFISQIKHYEPLTEKRTISIADIVKMGDKALRSRNFSWNNISAIGIGVSGLIDQENGRCLFLPNAPHW